MATTTFWNFIKLTGGDSLTGPARIRQLIHVNEDSAQRTVQLYSSGVLCHRMTTSGLDSKVMLEYLELKSSQDLVVSGTLGSGYVLATVGF